MLASKIIPAQIKKTTTFSCNEGMICKQIVRYKGQTVTFFMLSVQPQSRKSSNICSYVVKIHRDPSLVFTGSFSIIFQSNHMWLCPNCHSFI